MSELRAYRFEHSNTFIHRRSGDDSGWTPAHPQLARWVKRQRYQYKLMSEGKRSTTTEERIRELERAGFVWSVRTDQTNPARSNSRILSSVVVERLPSDISLY
uniref:Helicase-associated domain-containing protein n=1 Tax=Odontella aurita TaxID=265563 RepID=A0A7S4I127_9STRA|mmetsp:Transcript_18210/g.52610  ORF Transcript_18210/g.52610 Transcript_18210/m.52610 type:complete len:103 (-) Transcript_18210:960-1268(-)